LSDCDLMCDLSDCDLMCDLSDCDSMCDLNDCDLGCDLSGCDLVCDLVIVIFVIRCCDGWVDSILLLMINQRIIFGYEGQYLVEVVEGFVVISLDDDVLVDIGEVKIIQALHYFG